MKHIILLSTALLFLTACNSGVSDISNRTPKGNPNAAVIVTEYSDFQCPACRGAHFGLSKPIIEKYGNQIRFDLMHFPLRSIHRFALDASEATECAADQERFWEYVDTAFENQQAMNTNAFGAWARQLDLDMTLFDKCMKSHAKRDIVLEDYKVGRELGVGGTPTFYVNNKRIESGFDTLSAAIDAELERLTQRL